MHRDAEARQRGTLRGKRLPITSLQVPVTEFQHCFLLLGAGIQMQSCVRKQWTARMHSTAVEAVFRDTSKTVVPPLSHENRRTSSPKTYRLFFLEAATSLVVDVVIRIGGHVSHFAESRNILRIVLVCQ